MGLEVVNELVEIVGYSPYCTSAYLAKILNPIMSTISTIMRRFNEFGYKSMELAWKRTIIGHAHMTTKGTMCALVLSKALEKLNMFHPMYASTLITWPARINTSMCAAFSLSSSVSFCLNTVLISNVTQEDVHFLRDGYRWAFSRIHYLFPCELKG